MIWTAPREPPPWMFSLADGTYMMPAVFPAEPPPAIAKSWVQVSDCQNSMYCHNQEPLLSVEGVLVPVMLWPVTGAVTFSVLLPVSLNPPQATLPPVAYGSSML